MYLSSKIYQTQNISPGPLSRNRKSTHKVLAPRIDSKSLLSDETKARFITFHIRDRDKDFYSLVHLQRF
nr:hypothetical protein CFP56_60471 [Quercus suber]